jgi:hypothetical protein
MQHEIVNHLDNPTALEKIYRLNKTSFRQEFNAVYPTIQGNAVADAWHVRLNYESPDIVWVGRDLLFVIITALIAGLLAKIPAIFHVDEEFFYTRNIGFLVFPALTAYFAWKNKLSVNKLALIIGAMIAGLLYINLLPEAPASDTLLLACIHLLLFLWGILGFAFAEGRANIDKRLGYLRFNGDLVVMTTLIVISAGILSAITIGLFSMIGIQIEKFYFDYVVVFGLPAAPIIGASLTRSNPQLVGKVSPVIAKIFSPLVLVMLVIYLAAMLTTGKDPYNDREFLMMFNALLAGVMAIIFFSIAESTKTSKSRGEVWILFLLAGVTVVVNSIALSAILFRISEWGITPNRAAVLGANVLMLVNLMLVLVQVYQVLFKRKPLTAVGIAIATFLPIYIIWVTIVTFLFPLIFGFK